MTRNWTKHDNIERNLLMKCPKCGTVPFDNWDLGFMHRCHICKKVWRE